VDVGRFGLFDVAARLDDGRCEHGPAADLFPILRAHEIGNGERRAEIHGNAPGIEIRIDHVERNRSAGEHGHVANRTADGADVVGTAEVLRGVDLHDVAAGFPGLDDLGRRRRARDAEKIVFVCVLDDAGIHVRRDDDLRAGAAGERGVVRAAHGSGGDDDRRAVRLREGGHQLDRVGRRHRDLHDVDSVARVRVGDRLRRLETVFTDDTDDLFRMNAGQELFA